MGNVEKRSGSLTEDWDFLEPKQIKDPNQSKPADWVDEATIPDPDAVKPEDWDTELDGDWEAPLMPNPDYQGEWSAPMIPNPAYKGQWEHPMIDNPDYVYDSEIYAYKTAGVGIEIWQVKSGCLFDNILVTNDPAEAKAAAESIVAFRDHQKQAQAAEDEAARLEREEEMARLEAELDEEEEEDAHIHDEL